MEEILFENRNIFYICFAYQWSPKYYLMYRIVLTAVCSSWGKSIHFHSYQRIFWWWSAWTVGPVEVEQRGLEVLFTIVLNRSPVCYPSICCWCSLWFLYMIQPNHWSVGAEEMLFCGWISILRWNIWKFHIKIELLFN